MIDAMLTRQCSFAFRLALVLSCATSALAAQSFNGFWRSVQQMPDGNRSETVFLLQQEGSRLTGKVELPWSDYPLRNGVVHGKAFYFEIQLGASTWSYKGEIGHSGLKMVFHKPNATDVRLTAEPATTDFYPSTPPVPAPALHSVAPNGLALTPPMGWNSWNHFEGDIDDATVRKIADALVSTGMRDAGYVYVNIDDTWEGSRDDQGRIQPNRKFPDMKGLAGYLHARGLKLGLYSSPGPQTCGGYPGSYGHEELDAQTYAAWGVDYLKYDWCSAFRIYQDRDMRAIYQKMGDALLRSGRPIVYSLCQYGKEDVWTWGRLAGGNLWRTTNDIHNSYSRMAEIGFSQSALAAWSGPGGWNDPDMLEIGNGNLTVDESHTHMTLWAMLAAPLIAGNDLRSMSKETSSILLNREVIAIDQDPLGKQAQRVISDGSVEVWQRPLADGSSAVAIFNRSSSSQPAHFKWSSLGYAEAPQLRDLWKHVPLSEDGADFSAELPPHGVILLRAAQR